ncbi:monooxygenase [Antarcticimicrobium luteum]|uniref:Monooxygenase n=1 Tax=Antarcticimicrobium luteum TaxID=2547397 RepID=A0A4R5V053_9RHOB|nr:monooxygenase [Antarcticimicrobium luteum]TDK45054.1 monooxygenase [Antarcticimicrobium luteum]
MIIAIVRIPLEGPKRPADAVIRQSLESSVIFHEVPGLRRKYYLNSEAGGGGIYEFASREAAEAWFNDGWADWMEGRFGVRPTLELYDCPVVLDNAAGEVRVNGAPVPPPWRRDAG